MGIGCREQGAGEDDFSQSPITNYQLPITNYQLPITNYQLPITNYQLPNILNKIWLLQIGVKICYILN
ncbi:hypothetical protein [Anabaena sp. PCC 7938]|uniref:hypothetical protein n=1 Tax=Anabaena sp. PCC 7938 TaxID=1296340 RepID=UPI002033A6E6|nr:hypothetical protein [Anabaena sp. CCAP 1446/1C]MCM2406443.1 hypothetical protein [Anabaena sp. CCAP 1446/1C]